MKTDHFPKHEVRWPITLATLAVLGLYGALPEHLTPGPSWLLVGVGTLLLGLALLAHYAGKVGLNTVLGITLLVLLTVADAWALWLLIAGLPGKRQSPAELLRSAAFLVVQQHPGLCLLVLAARCRRPTPSRCPPLP